LHARPPADVGQQAAELHERVRASAASSPTFKTSEAIHAAEERADERTAIGSGGAQAAWLTAA
jgi:hypothetical protein